MEEIKDIMSTENADITFLLETDNSEENLKSIKIKDYETVVGRPGEHDKKVRMMAFVSDNISFKFREDLSSPDASVMWIEIERKNKKNVLIAGVYREWGYDDKNHPKNRSIDKQKERLQIITNSIAMAYAERKEIILTGDINLDMKRWDSVEYGDLKKVADLWRNAVSKHGLLYEDMGITYASFNGQTQSALDHIYVSSNIATNCRKLSKALDKSKQVIVCDFPSLQFLSHISCMVAMAENVLLVALNPCWDLGRIPDDSAYCRTCWFTIISRTFDVLFSRLTGL